MLRLVAGVGASWMVLGLALARGRERMQMVERLCQMQRGSFLL